MSGQLDLGMSVVYEDAQDYMAPLADLVQRFHSKVLLLPAHQRAFVWTEDKVKLWFDRLRLATEDRRWKPVGVIVTYQITNGKESPTWLNDGSQRVQATAKVLETPERYGYSSEFAHKIVQAIRIPVQHRHYSHEDDAVRDFQLLNLGTSLTPYELGHGFLVANRAFDSAWGPQLQRLHTTMPVILSRVHTHQTSKKRESIHRFYRHDYVLVVRWLVAQGPLDYDRVATLALRASDLDDERFLERQLAGQLKARPPELIEREVSLLIEHLHRSIELISAVWDELTNHAKRPMFPVAARWLLEASVWVRHEKRPIALWEDFVRKFLAASEGRTDIPGQARRRHVSLGRLSTLSIICRELNSSLYEGYQPRRRGRAHAMPGLDESHAPDQPFALFGDGPTTLEPASLNRARGMRVPIQGSVRASGKAESSESEDEQDSAWAQDYERRRAAGELTEDERATVPLQQVIADLDRDAE